MPKVRIKWLFCLFILSIVSHRIWAQQNLMLSKQWAVGLNLHYGFIAQHKLVSDHLITGHIPGFELIFQKHSTGGEEWQYRYQLPYYGINLAYYNLGNNQDLGNVMTAMAHIDFRLKYNRLKSGINFRPAVGVGYLTNSFNLRENYKNTLIGSRLNAAFKFQLDFYRYINWLNRISIGLSLTHFSNGAFQIPNAGVNIAGLNLTYLRSFGKTSTVRTFDPPDYSKKLIYYAWIGGFLKQIAPYNSAKQPVITLQNVVAWQPKTKFNFGVAVDAMFDPTVEIRVKDAGFATSTLTSLRVGVGAHYEQIIGRISIPVNFGVYLRNNFPEDGSVYQRIGLRYRGRMGWIYNATLKTHAAKADYFEFGIGKQFK